MSSHQFNKLHSPSTLEPKQDDHSTMNNTVMTEAEPLKDYLSTRQLPALDSLQNSHQSDDYIRIKLSGMSVGVSPNSFPRGHPQYQHEQRATANAYFPTQQEEERKRIYDPIRSSMPNSGNSSNSTISNTHLIRRIMHQDPTLSQRRHSIANMDVRSTFHTRNSNEPSITSYQPHQYQSVQQQQQHQNHYQINPFPGHYSAPSSPPMHSSSHHNYQHQKLNHIKHQHIPPPFTSYSSHRVRNNSTSSSNMDDDMIAPPPPPSLQQMRRNSSALVDRRSRENNLTSFSSQRMSSYSLHRTKQIGDSTSSKQEDEDEDDGMIINKQKRGEEMEGLYSRSPELRISHKLAERKRRKEMKDLFEELKGALPVDKSMKTSKWEILSKAVEYIGILRHRDYNMEQELGMLRHEVESLKSGKPPMGNTMQYRNHSGKQ